MPCLSLHLYLPRSNDGSIRGLGSKHNAFHMPAFVALPDAHAARIAFICSLDHGRIVRHHVLNDVVPISTFVSQSLRSPSGWQRKSASVIPWQLGNLGRRSLRTPQRTHKSDGSRSGSAAGHSSFRHNFPLKFSRPGHYTPLPCEIEYRYLTVVTVAVYNWRFFTAVTLTRLWACLTYDNYCNISSSSIVVLACSSSRNEYYLGGIIALLLQDHRTMSTKSVCSSQYMVTGQH